MKLIITNNGISEQKLNHLRSTVTGNFNPGKQTEGNGLSSSTSPYKRLNYSLRFHKKSIFIYKIYPFLKI